MSRKPLRTIVLGILILHSVAVFAQDGEVWRVSETEQRFLLTPSLDVVSVSGSGASSLGLGPALAADFKLTPTWILNAGLAQVFSVSDPGSLYTGFRLAIRYPITGVYFSTLREVRHGDKLVISEPRPAGSGWSVLAGSEQLLFNGSSAVYPAMGLIAGATWRTQVWNLPMAVEPRAGFYFGSNRQISTMLISIGVGLD